MLAQLLIEVLLIDVSFDRHRPLPYFCNIDPDKSQNCNDISKCYYCISYYQYFDSISMVAKDRLEYEEALEKQGICCDSIGDNTKSIYSYSM